MHTTIIIKHSAHAVAPPWILLAIFNLNSPNNKLVMQQIAEGFEHLFIESVWSASAMLKHSYPKVNGQFI